MGKVIYIICIIIITIITNDNSKLWENRKTTWLLGVVKLCCVVSTDENKPRPFERGLKNAFIKILPSHQTIIQIRFAS